MKDTDIPDTATRSTGALTATVQKAAEGVLGGAKKAAYAAAGAPVVVGRRITEYGSKIGSGLRHELEAFVDEGERIAEKLRSGDVVAELKERVDIDHLQDRVEQLRDQLEDVLAHWRESFTPEAPTGGTPPGEQAAPPRTTPASPKTATTTHTASGKQAGSQ